MKRLKRMLSIFLALCMMIGIAPTMASAEESTSDEVWDGLIATSFAGGTGTEANPYQISNGAQLAYLSQLVQQGTATKGKYYILTDDIYLNSNIDNYKEWSTEPPANSWTPIGEFQGQFDGSGHTIYGLYINSSEDYIGLFSTLNGATIRNLSVSNSYISGNDNVGSICGSSSWGSQIINCSNAGVVKGTSLIGGIVGSTYVSYVDCLYCYNTGDISGETKVGGILGQHTGGENGSNTILSYCYNTGDISGAEDIAGIVGCIGNMGVGGSYVKNCYNTGTITCTQTNGGG